MGKLYVGIDISKDRSSPNGIDDHGRSRFEISFDMDGSGFSELFKAIESESESNEGVVAAMESTACYHINLYSFLSAKSIEAVIINPLLIANYAKLSLRKTKTDKKVSRLDNLAQALHTCLKLKQNINTTPLNAVRKENNRLKHWVRGQLVKDAKARKEGDIATVLEGLKQLVAIFKEPWASTLLDNYFKKYKIKLEP